MDGDNTNAIMQITGHCGGIARWYSVTHGILGANREVRLVIFDMIRIGVNCFISNIRA